MATIFVNNIFWNIMFFIFANVMSLTSLLYVKALQQIQETIPTHFKRLHFCKSHNHKLENGNCVFQEP